MHFIDDLPFPLNPIVPLLVYVGVPLAIGVAVSFLVWKKSRAIEYAWLRACVRAVVLALCFTPTILLGTAPGLHGAIPIPYFAWGSIWSGITDHNQQALWFGFVPLVGCFGFLWLLFGLTRLP